MATSDKKSKWYIINYLKNKGWECEDTDNTNIYAHYDLKCSYNGHIAYIELKDRHFDSKKYGDIMIEKYKLDSLWDLENAYIISLYTDAVYLTDIHNCSYVIINKRCPKTTDWNREYVDKVLISFNIDECKKIIDRH